LHTGRVAIVILFRTVVRLIEQYKSRAWPVANGKVVKVWPPKFSQYPKVEIAYTYAVEGKLYTGMHTTGFWLHRSARQYSDQFMSLPTLFVRYRPGEPKASVVRLDDQLSPGSAARSFFENG